MDEDGNTALHLAALGGYTSALKVLIKTKAVIDTTNDDGETALHIAASNNYVNAAFLLLDSGCAAAGASGVAREAGRRN